MITDKAKKQLEAMKSTIPAGAVMARDIIPDSPALKALEEVVHISTPSPESTDRVVKAVAALGGVERVIALGQVLNAQEAAKKNPVERKYEDIPPRHITLKDMEGILRNTLRVGARPSCRRCNGRGVYGYKAGTNIPILCSCARITGVLQ